MRFSTILKSTALCATAAIIGIADGFAQTDTLIYNKGALFFVNGGPNDSALVWVDGTVVNQDSIIINKGKFVINGDFVNNAQCGGDNTPPLLLPGNDGLFEVYGNWENNGVYFAGSGQVKFMANDTIKGTSVTQFNKLTLNFDVIRVMDGIDAEIGLNGRLELNRGELATDYNTMWVLNPNVTSITRFNPCVTCGFVSAWETVLWPAPPIRHRIMYSRSVPATLQFLALQRFVIVRLYLRLSLLLQICITSALPTSIQIPSVCLWRSTTPLSAMSILNGITASIRMVAPMQQQV
jgi:hypothetical protein